ncbi:C13 family peptidase [Luteimonas notoginsengisoli]|uniref:C13 family peptidase n=1 Tax=Luteimonas notoginsengisoli TaxID=1578200 RepID=A0ABV7UTB7_9GAMM
MIRRRRSGVAAVLFGIAALLLLPACAEDESVGARDRRLIAGDIAALAPQRPGQVDLYVVGFAGDSTENVFRNEVAYLDELMSRRFGAQDRVVTLVNHLDSLTTAPRPLATLQNLRIALAGVGEVMDRDEDVLLLYLTLHGTEDHELAVQLPPVLEQWITPRELRKALDDAGIRNRVVAISACYSGGFIPALREPRTLVVTAARADRASFGCGSESDATYFGRAWLVDGLNRSNSFAGAYDIARGEISRWEREDGETPSLPQIDVGDEIAHRLGLWRSQFVPGPVVPYPYDDNTAPADAGSRLLEPAATADPPVR